MSAQRNHLPWGRFFWNDWRGEPTLRVCSLAARGLWMDMLCIAAEADPTGFVLVNGRTPTTTDLARLTGAPEADVQSLLAELDRNGVFSRDRQERIYSRRMVRDAKRARTARSNGKRGGNPTLSKQRANRPSDNPSDKGGLNTQKPEARSQKDSEPIGSGAMAPSQPEDLKSRIFGPALEWLAKQAEKPKPKIRSIVGKWCRDHGDGRTLEEMQNCARAGAVDPIAWIEAKLNGTTKQTYGQPFKTSELLERMAENEAGGFGEEDNPEGDADAVPLAVSGPERGAGSGVPNGDHRKSGAVQSDGGRAFHDVGEVQADVDEDDMADAWRSVPSALQ